ncbi:MAG: PQQ-binding-like beta-propeller repeat protein [Candidatus Aminicenantales bacterium]
MRKTVFLLLILILAASCSFFQQGEDVSSKGAVFSLEKSDEIVYRGEIAGEIRRNEKYIYFSTWEGILYCVDVNLRKISWAFKAGSSISFPFLFSGNIYFYDEQNTIYCLDLSGREVWRKKSEKGISSHLGVAQGMVVFATSDGGITALNAFEGKVVWKFEGGGSSSPCPVFWDSLLIFSSGEGRLFFLNHGGKPINTFDAGVRAGSPLFIDGNFLYFGSTNGYFSCFNLIRRKLRWRADVGGKVVVPPLFDAKRIFIISWDSVLFALHKKSGSLLWWRTLPGRSYFKPAMVDGKIVVTSLSSKLVCFEAESGRKLGDYRLEREARSNPVWLNPYLVVSVFEPEQERGKLVFLKKTLPPNSRARGRR